METIHGAPSYVLHSPEVDLAVTQIGGHLAPVTFHLGDFKASPYSLSPWAPTQIAENQPSLIRYLRGDFLCLPFGGQKSGPPHGDTANAEWHIVRKTRHELVLTQQAGDTGAKVTKTASVMDGHHAIYLEHVIENLSGEWNYGNHPVLDLSSLPEGAARVAVSDFRWASVYPGEFSDPAAGESGALRPNAEFMSLRSVPLRNGGETDLTRYPSRRGFDDLVMMVNVPPTEAQPFAWTAVTFPGYVWFQLKDPLDFPSTLFWLSNGGRPGHPWEKRHLGRLGLEEVCSHFCDGVDVAREHRLAGKGIPTTRAFRADQKTRLPLIQGAVAVPADFGLVRSIAPAGDGHIRITGENGHPVVTRINWKFLKN